MRKGILVLLVSVLLLTFVLAGVGLGNQWHHSDIILVEINGYNITLQDAINNNYFGSVVPTGNSDYSYYSHLASEVLIRTPNGYTMTLQEASDTDSFVSGVGDGTVEENTGHLASEVNVYSKSGEEMTLQDLIDIGKVYCDTCADIGATCGTHNDGCGQTLNCGGCGSGESCFSGSCSDITWSTGSWSSASSCGATTTRTVNCVNSDGSVISDSVCYDVLGQNSKPSTSKTVSCEWVKGDYSGCGGGIFAEIESGGSSSCSSVVGSSCTSLGSQGDCKTGSSCKCGSTCWATKHYTVTCNIA